MAPTDDAAISPGRGACFGYSIRSTLPFHYLRGGGGSPLMVDAPAPDGASPGARLVYEWAPRPGQPFHARLYQDGNLYHLWSEGDGWFMVEPQVPRILVPEGGDGVLREEAVWGVPAALCLLHRDDLSLHAAAVEVGDGAVVFAAPGRFGKTTLAAAFCQAGYRVLSEDLTCVRLEPSPAVIPGPAMLRLRRDTAAHLNLATAGVVRMGEHRSSFALNPETRGTCRPVPLKAIVLLRIGDSFAAERVRPQDALADLWFLSLRVPGEALLARCFEHVADLAGKVPVWNVHRPMRFEELPRTVEWIISRCLPDG